MRAEWDTTKDLANQRKHDVSFGEAAELLSGREHLEIFDADHSDVEDRFISIGVVRRGVVLVVWTERDEDVIGIISARWATNREQKMYREDMEQRHEG